MVKVKNKGLAFLTILMILITTFLCFGIRVNAAEAVLSFGSDRYEENANEKLNVGLYISSKEVVGKYSIVVKYDTNILEYVEGADRAETGKLYLEGNANGTEAGYFITFKTVASGNGNVVVDTAEVYDTSGKVMEITNKPSAPIEVGAESNSKHIENNNSNNNAEGGFFEKNKALVIVVFAAVVVVVAILVISKSAEAIKRRKRKARRRAKRLKKERELLKSLYAEENLQELGEDKEPLASLYKENKQEVNKDSDTKKDETGFKADTVSIQLDERPNEKPVISVENVTMRFKISNSNASGIKEYLIQKIKKQVTTRELVALDDINFKVYKGEVVGIIGTNGSGKSTLLKIVAGALNPTSGRVRVDKRKIQILTLGTGFDFELSARENVYLNGAIIGYTKEFIDANYDKIVEFAELEGFMDEKVKNFSSGMVSRLGFAIATVGNAAEILILDEVLSVGDEFFRKKSLARVTEMIKGGSTVLMVSHSMGTIQQYCTKCVWIEKGVMKMVGEAKRVCEEYRKMSM